SLVYARDAAVKRCEGFYRPIREYSRTYVGYDARRVSTRTRVLASSRGRRYLIMNPDIQRKILKFETFVNDVLKEDLAQLEQKLDVKNADIAEFLQLKATITTFKNNGLDKSGFKTQVDIGQNFFIEAQVSDASTILLDIGLGHYLELSIDDAVAIINVRVKLLEQQIKHFRKEIARTNAHIKLILLGIRELQGFDDKV
ncbi:Protein UXT like protein, partial [Melipona quadrifasciata]